MNIVGIIAIISCFMLPEIAQAHELIVLGVGGYSCGTWITDRGNSDPFSMGEDRQWVLGFITNEESHVSFDQNESVTLNTDANGIFGWLDNYCEANPTVNIYNAIAAFLRSNNLIVVAK
jgi:hypothetical protein